MDAFPGLEGTLTVRSLLLLKVPTDLLDLSLLATLPAAVPGLLGAIGPTVAALGDRRAAAGLAASASAAAAAAADVCNVRVRCAELVPTPLGEAREGVAAAPAAAAPALGLLTGLPVMLCPLLLLLLALLPPLEAEVLLPGGADCPVPVAAEAAATRSFLRGLPGRLAAAANSSLLPEDLPALLPQPPPLLPVLLLFLYRLVACGTASWLSGDDAEGAAVVTIEAAVFLEGLGLEGTDLLLLLLAAAAAAVQSASAAGSSWLLAVMLLTQCLVIS
jgi:hypothetical protein